ncbi:hypothetical protein ACGFSB_06775 [Streptomyces sp. NPDC048441]|uniref:hypothetical protein n=1 Tax=Streptomyces sp. NPDC048441 TaxID=3365552 RepID=UPI00371516F3
MTQSSVPVRCPVCRREHAYAPPAYPCVCGAPVIPPVTRGAAVSPVTDLTWADEWVTVLCLACGRPGQWPQPELDCGCGAVLRIPVGQPPVGPPPGTPPGRTPPVGPAHIPLPRTAPVPRPAFQPIAVRTARDVVTVAALYLRWLGYRDIGRAVARAPSGIRVTAKGVVALIEPSVRPLSARDVECVWLTAMADSTACLCFSLAGYEDAAHARAESLSVPLFVIDLTGAPQPVNSPADELMATGVR